MRLYPHFPSLPRYPGPYNVGTLDLEVPLSPHLHKTFGAIKVKTLLVRLFYPTVVKSGSKPRWTGPGNYTIQGYSNFLGVNENLLQFISYFGLKWTTIPAHTNATLLARPETSDSGGSRWPCCLFSHGLGGSRNAYSQISGSVASGGLVVMALEHRDNSAAITVQKYEEEPAEVIEYMNVKDSNSSTIKKRRDQMDQRAYETKLGVELFRALDNPESTSAKCFSEKGLTRLRTRTQQFTNHLDVGHGRFIMSGHSMGAATSVHVCKNSSTALPSDPAGYRLGSEFRAAVLLDPWMEVLVDSSSRPLQLPSIAIVSQAFHDWSGNFREVVQLLKGQPQQNRLCYLKGSAHLSQSDFQLLFPTATKYAFKAGIDPHLAMDLNVRLVRDFLRTSIGLEVPLGKEKEGVVSEDIWKEEAVVACKF